jgi:hypothetical protein
MMNSGKENNLYHGFLEVAAEACPYFGNWTYNSPLVISPDTNLQMHKIQKIFYKAICHFGEHYDEYRHLMPVKERVYEILSLSKQKPYRPGTYRTDFIIDENNEIKLIEITCRFALNGFFTSGFFILLADQFLQGKFSDIKKVDEYSAFYDYFMRYFGEFDHVCILKGSDNRNETKYSISIFEKAGYKTYVIPAAVIADNLHLFENAAVIGELDHDELCNLPLKVVEAIIQSNQLNDLRTVFLIHDKRFFSVLGNDAFLQSCLNASEIELLKQVLVPTYTPLEQSDLWLDARQNKNNWILKHRALGKGVNVYAGCVTDEVEWQKIFESDIMADMILQPFIKQRRINGSVGDNTYYDYVVGTLLFFDDNFFGPGLFRTSSYPVTNKVDDRKIAPLVTADTGWFEPQMIL